MGVISLLGDSLHERRVGLTAFQNKRVYHDVSEWGVNGYVEDIITERLSPRFQMVDIDYLPDRLEKVYTDNIFKPVDFARIANELTEIHKASGVDGMLIITDYPAEDPIGYTNQILKRYGIYDRRVFRRMVAGYAIVNIALIESATLKPIASWGTFKQVILDKKIADDFDHMSDSEKEMVKKAIFNSLQKAITGILTDMTL